MDNVEIFFAVLAADAETGKWIHSLVGESCCSSCFAETNRPLAFAWDLVGIRSCAGDN